MSDEAAPEVPCLESIGDPALVHPDARVHAIRSGQGGHAHAQGTAATALRMKPAPPVPWNEMTRLVAALMFRMPLYWGHCKPCFFYKNFRVFLQVHGAHHKDDALQACLFAVHRMVRSGKLDSRPGWKTYVFLRVKSELRCYIYRHLRLTGCRTGVPHKPRGARHKYLWELSEVNRVANEQLSTTFNLPEAPRSSTEVVPDFSDAVMYKVFLEGLFEACKRWAIRTGNEDNFRALWWRCLGNSTAHIGKHVGKTRETIRQRIIKAAKGLASAPELHHWRSELHHWKS